MMLAPGGASAAARRPMATMPSQSATTHGEMSTAGAIVAIPESNGWVWTSTNPGISTESARSITSASGAAARHCSTLPMAVIRPSATTIA